MTQTSARWIATGLLILVMSLTLEAAKRPSISVSPNGATLQSGQTQQFTATILRSSGTPVWSATGGTITTTGLYTAGSLAGSFTVRATISGTTISSTRTVTIPAPAPTPTPTPTPTPSPTGVQIAPGQSIQAAIDANPSGTTFTLLAGTHRLSTAIKPKSGDSLVGQAGTVLSGARLLTSFSQSGNYWTATGQTQQGPRTAYGAAPECQTSYPLCGYPEDLFFDGTPLRHVDALSKVVSGTWFFDYAADIIYFVNDPTGHTVETSVTTYAVIGSGQTAVKLRNLVVEKFANPAQIGAVNADGAAGWLVDGCTFQLNHGTGLSFTSSSGVTISNNRFTMQGQLGIGTYDTDAFLVVNNEIDHNNFAGFDTSWEAGGTKFVWSRNMTVRGNWAHHNSGKGLWTDGDNIGTLYDSNTASDNTDHGIFHEISYDAVIRNNTAERNGWNGIVVASSPNVEIYGNTVAKNGRAQIFGRQDYAGRVGKYGESVLMNFFVHDNLVTASAAGGGAAGIQPQNQAAGDTTYFLTKNNVFVNNTYNLTTASPTPFVWMLSNRSDAQWTGYGEDVPGTLLR